MAASVRTTWKLLPEASRTKRSSGVVCFLAQLWSWAIGTLLNIFSVTAAAGVGPRTTAAVKVSGCESKPMTRWAIASLFIRLYLLVVQADGNRSGDYMHSGMRGSPHVGAFRRCSFAKTESYSYVDSRASSRNPPAG